MVDVKSFNFEFINNLYMLSSQIKPQIVALAEYEPVNFYELFGNNNPVNIEIGIGNGEFLNYMAKKHINENFLGFEFVKKVFIKAIKKMEREYIKNVRLIHYDAVFFIKMLPANSLKNIYINFPDPWPKKKHQKRRLINKSFFNLIRDKITLESNIYIVTDHSDYAMQISKSIEETGFKSALDGLYSNHLIDYFETKYYRKFACPSGVYFFKIKKN